MAKKSSLTIAIAQMNPTVGDYRANSEKIVSWIIEAEKKNADIIIFPECALCGYPVWDLANKQQFVKEGLKELQRIALASSGKGIAVVLGFVDASLGTAQRGTANVFNALAWIEKGKIRTVYHKQLLPTYDVFLEEIFFQPGSEAKIVLFKGHKVGLTICEDIWDERYKVKPLAGLVKKKADFILNISASPYYRDVAAARERLLKGHTRHYGIPILYVNQVGGQDDLLFDGRSMFMDAKGRSLFRAPAFEEGLFIYFFDPSQTQGISSGSNPPVCFGVKGISEIYQALVMGVRDYFRKNGFKKAVIGLSGGIDSALVAAIAMDALGKDAVKGVTMPGPFSSKGSWMDSKDLAKALGIEFETRPICTKYETWLQEAKIPATRSPTLAMENLQARLRGMELMFISNDESRLVLTTGNKSELAMGYCTLYGDMAGGLAVIGDVYKTDVFKLCYYRNTISPVIPESILKKPPSAELRPDQKDEDSLPPYAVLDEVLCLYIEKNLNRDEIIRRLKEKVSGEVVTDVVRKVDHNEYKRRQTPPILRVTEKAWFGRRMPITNKFIG